MRCCCGLAISYLQPLFSRPHLDITCIKFLEYYQLHVYKTCIKTTPWKQRKFHISFLVKSFWEIVILDKCFCKLSVQTTFFLQTHVQFQIPWSWRVCRKKCLLLVLDLFLHIKNLRKLLIWPPLSFWSYSDSMTTKQKFWALEWGSWAGKAYLILVIFFTHAKFLENKIYTEIYTVNCQFTQ